MVDRLTIWRAASSTKPLGIIFAGAGVELPISAGCTVFGYRVFRGKTKALPY